jgi:beta-glucanase (GH16 family)
MNGADAQMKLADPSRASRRPRLFIYAIALCVLVAACVIYWRSLASSPNDRDASDHPPDSARSTPPDSTAATPPGIPGAWVLIFEDQFEGSTLAKVWTPHQYWADGPTVGEGEEESDPDNVSVLNGSLRLTARQVGKFGKPYTGALVQAGGIRGRSRPTFSFLYGYAEARIRIPAGQGLWPAFWLMPASYHDANGEIDILDNGTGNPYVLHGGALRQSRQDQHQLPRVLSPGFHLFAVDWQRDHLTWYLDGKPWAQTADPTLICPEPAYPIFDLAVGGAWGGPPNAATTFPAVMEVDWIRIWQRS